MVIWYVNDLGERQFSTKIRFMDNAEHCLIRNIASSNLLERQKLARKSLRRFALETVSSFPQTRVVFIEVAGLKVGWKREKLVY